MIPASQAFHEAAKAGAKQRTLLHFTDSDKWFTAFDYGLDAFTYEDPFNTEEDPAIGLTSAAHVAFTLIQALWLRYSAVSANCGRSGIPGSAGLCCSGVCRYRQCPVLYWL